MKLKPHSEKQDPVVSLLDQLEGLEQAAKKYQDTIGTLERIKLASKRLPPWLKNLTD